MSKNYVFSTLANDQLYTNWLPGGGDMPIKGHSVLIKGGTGVADDRLITPLGVSTEITDYDLEELKAKKAETEKVAADMNLKDESAPLTDADYQKEDAPKVGLN